MSHSWTRVNLHLKRTRSIASQPLGGGSLFRFFLFNTVLRPPNIKFQGYHHCNANSTEGGAPLNFSESSQKCAVYDDQGMPGELAVQAAEEHLGGGDGKWRGGGCLVFESRGRRPIAHCPKMVDTGRQ